MCILIFFNNQPIIYSTVYYRQKESKEEFFLFIKRLQPAVLEDSCWDEIIALTVLKGGFGGIQQGGWGGEYEGEAGYRCAQG